MGTEIVEKQNSPEMLICLAAQRQLYSTAKTLFLWQLILSTVLVIILSILSLYIDISWILAAYVFLIAIIDIIFISPQIKRQKEEAAGIQEIFDTTVLDITWNDLLVGDKPSNEEIYRYSEKYRKKYLDFESLKNWYSHSVSKINSNAAKIVCQRSNCVYDYSIRESFSKAVLVVLLITLLLLLGVGFIKGLTLQNFFLIAFPFLPAIMLFVRTVKENNLSKEALDNLKKTAESIWNKILLGKEINLNRKSRAFQDKIYLNRKNSPLIFDWYYYKKRNQLEKEMKFSVDQLVREYKNRRDT
jgi:hypothetical protein